MFETLGRTLGSVLFAGLVLGLATAAVWAEEKKEEPAPKIQMAILLDTSNSMDGLINQARTQLWKVVNEFTTIKLAGKTPKLEVALYEYGNNGIPQKDGYIRQVVPLTTDLDRVSEAMFALKTNGGDEYCGQVIQVASARTVSRVSCGWKRMPPLAGPRASLCCTRKPRNTFTHPSSIRTGMAN